MTRINVVPVQTLCDQHLLAEYRELPRVAAAAAKRHAKTTTGLPDTYRMGTGHVLFFYDKGEWLARRHAELCQEMVERGFTVNFPFYPEETHPTDWLGDWQPEPQDLETNQHRINERLATMQSARWSLKKGTKI